MRFVLEESSWAWDGTRREDYIERIEQFIDRLDVIRERGEAHAASREWFSQTVLGSYTLYELLWNPDLPLNLPPEVQQRFAALLGPLHYWDDEREWPGLEARIGDAEVLSPAAVLAHERVSAGQATACVPLPGRFRGPCDVSVGPRTERVHFVADEASHRAFFRDALDVERVNEAELEQLAPHAYPDLHFLEDVWKGLGHFEGGYARVRDSLHRLLAVLDDHGAWVFTDTTGRLSPSDPKPADGKKHPITNQLIERRFIGWGFAVAPERPNVREDTTCRQARERVLKGRTLYCEWHYKFEPHINRAHIHAPVPQSDGRLVVAIFKNHLPLP